MTDFADSAIKTVDEGLISFCKFITPNDTGASGAHQCGFYIPKNAYNIFFDKQGVRGIKREKFITILWQGEIETNSRAVYYGQKSRDEYRLTQFGRKFPFLKQEYVGGLFIITRFSRDRYKAFILSSKEEIDKFLGKFGLTFENTNKIIPTNCS